VILGALVIAVFAGCAASPVPTPTLSSTPDAAPLFDSDEEALAAAEEAYAAYQAMSNQIARDGGNDVERLAPMVTAKHLEKEEIAFASFVDKGWTGDGGVEFDSMRLQRQVETDRVATITVYLCMDVANARLLDARGQDVTPSTRAIRTPLEVTFVSAKRDSRSLVMEASDIWSGADFC
jgi:hypothetical protein